MTESRPMRRAIGVEHMRRIMLVSKIHRATDPQAELECAGSIAVDTGNRLRAVRQKRPSAR
jgi:hypothetical protein